MSVTKSAGLGEGREREREKGKGKVCHIANLTNDTISGKFFSSMCYETVLKRVSPFPLFDGTIVSIAVLCLLSYVFLLLLSTKLGTLDSLAHFFYPHS